MWEITKSVAFPVENAVVSLLHVNLFQAPQSFFLMNQLAVSFGGGGYFSCFRLVSCLACISWQRLSHFWANFYGISIGLDSTAATSLVQTLRELADSGKTVIAVIHQPSQHVFAAFDDLLLVSEGKQMYFGEVAGVRNYMETHACEAPAEMGTAEHILDCISKSELFGETHEEAQSRMEKLSGIALNENINIGPITSKAVERFSGRKGGGPRANIFIQFKLLLQRSLRENFRDVTKLIIQTVQQVTIGVVYGGIYSLGSNQVRFFEVSSGRFCLVMYIDTKCMLCLLLQCD